jgi:thiazole/oxazole-forming peptide maturase SagD family component
MEITIHDEVGGLRGHTHALMNKMVGPLCGLDKSISYLLRDRNGPRFYVAGGDLTGVHVLRNQHEPPKGFYHIGGCGIERQESMIRTLGETIERYTQFLGEIQYADQIVFETYETMLMDEIPVIDFKAFNFFSDEQYKEKGFPYQPFSPTEPISWLKVESVSGEKKWVPAQLFLVGYTIKDGERWIQAAVTTGSAAHVTKEKAARNALLEMIQLDTSMGHWYTDNVAQKIIMDERTKAIQAIIARQFPASGPKPHFYWQPSPDLPGFTVACILKQKGKNPKFSIGQSCELKLQDAMYKALLEAVGVYHLARLKIFELSADNPEALKNPSMIKDLDTNVAFYGIQGESELIQKKFASTDMIKASDLPKDYPDSYGLNDLIKAFTDANLELYELDTTTVDAEQLGFKSWRFWSPDVLTLCFPGTPNSKHKRFEVHGGFTHYNPHPYP